jgi:hypothetical protein
VKGVKDVKSVQDVKRASFLLLTAFVSASVGVRAQQAVTADDIAVLKAVIDQKIRPEAERFAPKDRSPGVLPLIAYDRSLALCGPEGSVIPAMGCLMQMDIPLLDFGIAMNSAIRRQLQQAMASRNATSAPFPSASFESIIPMAPEKRAEVTSRESARTRGWASFALPAYASNGQAAVYARYICGGLCGTSWYFLLEKSSNGWRVINEKVVSVSGP